MIARGILSRFARDQRGVAAVEMSLVGGLLATALLNVVEVSRYAYMSAQVGAASQAAAHAALVKCDPSETPVTLNCPDVAGEITKAIRGSSLGTRVHQHGALSERWYCLTATGALQDMSAAGTRPASCADAGDAMAKPGLYLRVQTDYTYDPLFPGLTIAETFSETIVRTAWMRLR
ncbi:MAG TPA: TadE/TadG family type IV pilus assembly protein [Nonomuraea sp.]|nr:TadE/TadG family type IV pilus assembly protein [Nonomuraea sp.]